MIKFISVLICILFALILFLPIGTLTAAFFGCSFEIISIPALAIIIAVLSFAILLIDLISVSKPDNKKIRMLICFVPPLTIINGVFCIFVCNDISVFISTLVSAGCSIVLLIDYGKPSQLKAVSTTVFVLFAIQFVFLNFIAMVFGDFSQDTVVYTVESPNGKYYAQVIDNDQGALGGSTLVEICENPIFDAVVFKVEKLPKRIYSGSWGEYEDMAIYWKDNNCLIIDSVEYTEF